ncbi:hypothetical protein DL98DRAFT_511218 [Cadophora sp. DSE1049]|nr:hypothetical protein DL98DRAFT_511218 [Cadophora sp. DSE1049]
MGTSLLLAWPDLPYIFCVLPCFAQTTLPQISSVGSEYAELPCRSDPSHTSCLALKSTGTGKVLAHLHVSTRSSRNTTHNTQHTGPFISSREEHRTQNLITASIQSITMIPALQPSITTTAAAPRRHAGPITVIPARNCPLSSSLPLLPSPLY